MPEWLILVLLVLVCLVGLVLSALRLPGAWLMVAAALGYGWWSDWQPITPTIAIVLVVLAGVGEGLELLMSVVTAKRVGASHRAAWGGLIGGILGMFMLSLPMPIIGTLFGAMAGCFAGAMIAELSVQQTTSHSARVGVFSVIGMVLGAVAKLGVALVICGLLLISVACPSKLAESPLGETPIAEGLSGEEHGSP